MSYERIDLDHLDETADDLSAWAYEDEETQTRARNDEQAARAATRPLASGVHVTTIRRDAA